MEKESKKFARKNLRILVFMPDSGIGSYILHDCIDGLKDLGHEVKELIHRGPRSVSKEKLIDEISCFQPNFLLTYDHTGIRTELLTELKIPYASYFGETPFLWWLGYEPMSKSISPYCVLFMWDKTYIPELKRRGFEHVFYLPLGANPNLFRRIQLSEEEKKIYECNLSFVGGPFCRESNPEVFSKLYGGIEFHPEGKLVIEEAITLLSQNPLLSIRDILEVVQHIKGIKLPIMDSIHQEMVEVAIQYEAMTRYRREVLEAVADAGLHFYGAPEWKKVLKDDKLKYLGWIMDREELVKLYNGSKINLNTTSSIISGGLPMRVFDILSCGSFLLTDYRSVLGDFFEIDREVVCYMDKVDLKEKVEYFLAHPEEREEIARRGQERVLREHTYRHRMEKLVEIMRGIFGGGREN